MGTDIGIKVEGAPGDLGKFKAVELNSLVKILDNAMVNDGTTGLKDAIDESVIPFLEIYRDTDSVYKARNIKNSLGETTTLNDLKGKMVLKANLVSDFLQGDSLYGKLFFSSFNIPDINKTLENAGGSITIDEGIVNIYCDFDNNTFSIIENVYSVNSVGSLLLRGSSFSLSTKTSNAVEYTSIDLNGYGLNILDNITDIDGVVYQPGLYNVTDNVMYKALTKDDNVLINLSGVTEASYKSIYISSGELDSLGRKMGPGPGKTLTINGMDLLIANDVIYVKSLTGAYTVMNNGKPVVPNDHDFISMFTCTGDVRITFTGTSMKLDGNAYTSNTFIPAGTYILEGMDITTVVYADINFTSIHIERNSKQTNASNMFRNLTNLTTLTAEPDTFGSVTNMYFAWGRCRLLTTFPLIDTSSVTSMLGAWDDCTSLTSFPLIDTSNVTNMWSTWHACSSLTSFPAIDTSNVTTMSSTWNICSSLTSFPAIDTSNVTIMSNTWNTCSSLTSFPAIDTSNVTSMYATWNACSSLTSFPLVDFTKVTSTYITFSDCTSLVCMGGFTRPLNQAYRYNENMFANTPALLYPNATEQASILAGNQWINPNAC